jgi:pimeloyl-ACP methyl ester carboxylesterase
VNKLRGWKKLVSGGVDEIVGLVQRTHHAVAERQLRRLDLVVPEVGEVARAVDEAHRTIADVVYGSIRVINRGVDGATDVALAAVPASSSAEAESPIEASPGSAHPRQSVGPWIADAAQSALNGVFGDYLHQRGNELDLGMTLHAAIATPALELTAEPLAAALPAATPRLVIFVHGLATNEWCWRLGADKHAEPGEPGETFAERLAARGFTSLFARYNSGRHVSESGALLAEELDRLVDAYPVEIEQLALVGHSMGGLVLRSAAHQAKERGLGWVDRLRQLVCIGSPHHGAPLEKLANVVVNLLGAIDTAGTQVPAEVIAARSDGIKDLRFGYTIEQEWRDRDPEALLCDYRQEIPYLDQVPTCFIGSTITRDPNHPLGRILGDLLVRLPSALPGESVRGDLEPFALSTELSGLGHLDLLTHPDVYAQLERLLDA